MGEIDNLNNTSWFVNPRFDILLLAGFPIVLIVFLMHYLYMYNPRLSYYEYVAFNIPHVFSGFTVVYMSEQEYKKRPMLFLVIPSLIFISTIIFWFLRYSFQLKIIRFYWGWWHIFSQYYYILLLYKLRNNDYLRTDKILDVLPFIIVFIHLLLRHLYQIQNDVDKIYLYGISIDSHLLKHTMNLSWFIIVTFILRQAYLFIRWKIIFPFKIFMISTFILTYHLLSVKFKDAYVAQEVVIIIHNIQYIAWVWFYHRQKFKKRVVNKAKVISYLSQPDRILLYFLSLFLISIAFNFIMISTFGLIRYKAIIYALAFNHFFLDGIIWKISKVNSIINK